MPERCKLYPKDTFNAKFPLIPKLAPTDGLKYTPEPSIGEYPIFTPKMEKYDYQ